MRTKQCSLLSKFLLGMSLAFSLSGCSSRFANLYVGYGITRTSYPKPTEQTCFHNHEIFLDEQGGLQRYEREANHRKRKNAQRNGASNEQQRAADLFLREYKTRRSVLFTHRTQSSRAVYARLCQNSRPNR